MPAIIPLFSTFPQLEQLYAQCVAAPGEDTVRWAFRDHLEECAEESPAHRDALRDWAELFRVQYRLREIGPKPLTLLEDVHIQRLGGPDYFQTQVDEDTKITPGDRVTIEVFPSWARHKKLQPIYHRLLVRKVVPGGYFGKTVTIIRDAESTPYPQVERDELLNTQTRLCGANLFWRFDQIACWLGGAGSEMPLITWERGLPSHARVSNGMNWLDGAVKDYPIGDVTFRHLPNVHWMWLSNSRRVSYSLDDWPHGKPPEGPHIFYRPAQNYAEAQSIAYEVSRGEPLKDMLRARWPLVCNWHLPE